MITTSYYNTIVAAQDSKSAHASPGADADSSDNHKPKLTRRRLILMLPVRMYVYMYVCMCACMYICMYVHMYICMYIHTYVHTYACM